MKKLTAAALFTYADQYARAAEATDKGTVYPTVREATKHFRATQAAVEETVGDYCGDGYLGLAVGFKNGNGYATYKHRGDYRIEAYRDEPQAECVHEWGRNQTYDVCLKCGTRDDHDEEQP